LSFFHRRRTKNENRARAKDAVPIDVKITAKEKVNATTDEMYTMLMKELPSFK